MVFSWYHTPLAELASGHEASVAECSWLPQNLQQRTRLEQPGSIVSSSPHQELRDIQQDLTILLPSDSIQFLLTVLDGPYCLLV